MKRILFSVVIFATAAAALWAADMMSVQVDTAQMRARPSFVGPVTQELSYGDRVEVLNGNRGWLNVRSDTGTTGWMQESALTKKEVVLSSSGSVSTGASTEEVALAGKGFNADVEKQYKAETQLDFSWVDRMEEWAIPAEELIVFLEEGELEGVIQ